ncbi:MAG: hypothetical protein ACLRXC_10520 [[Clostridium] leptum]
MEKLEAGFSLNNIDKFLPLIYPQPATAGLSAGRRADFLRNVCERAQNLHVAALRGCVPAFAGRSSVQGLRHLAMEFPRCWRRWRAALRHIGKLARSLPEVRLSELVSLNAVALLSGAAI